jgi:hypothetical protein
MDYVENTASYLLHCCVLRSCCLTTGVFAEPFPSNGSLCWLHSSCLEQICHSMYVSGWDESCMTSCSNPQDNRRLLSRTQQHQAERLAGNSHVVPWCLSFCRVSDVSHAVLRAGLAQFCCQVAVDAVSTYSSSDGAESWSLHAHPERSVFCEVGTGFSNYVLTNFWLSDRILWWSENHTCPSVRSCSDVSARILRSVDTSVTCEKVLSSSIGHDNWYPDWGFSWFSSVLAGKCRDSTSASLWPLPFKPFPIHSHRRNT